MTLENYERAKEYFEAAEAKLQEDLEGDLCDSKLSSYVITMRYNLARCLEHLCLFEDAEVLYKGILREEENYTDCYLRLGCLARDRGQIYESSIMKSIALLTLAVDLIHASFCGSSAIPYSFEALSDGQPVLGCARPVCFGWNASGQPATDDGEFYRIRKFPDGFMRKDDISVPPYHNQDPRYFHQQVAECEPTFQSHSCDGDNQWAGGIAPLLNISAFPLVMQCCKFEPLRLSTDRGVAIVKRGQIVVGGEVSKNGTQYAFDYISNIVKTLSLDGYVTYEVNIRRFMCLSPVQAKQHWVGSPKVQDVQEFRRAPLHHKAFQASIFPAGDTINTPNLPITGIEGPFDEGENVVVEEEVAQDGIEIDITTSAPATDTSPVPQQPVTPPQVPQEPPVPQQPFFPQQQFIAEPIYYPAVGQAPVPPVAPAAPAYSSPGSYYCFTADTTVHLIDGSKKRLDELQVEDWVQTLNGAEIQYAPVSFWLHRVPTQSAEFHKIELSDGTVLKITAKHFIYKATCTNIGKDIISKDLSDRAIFAEEVSEGDCLYLVTKEERIITAQVKKVSKVNETGIYSPMTSNGKIIVNGIYASCHNIIESYSLQNTFFSYVETMRRWYSWLFEDCQNASELPTGMNTLITLMDYVIPRSLITS
ncbi:unnamed protein product [Cylicocyclus nassatus]|uniref:Uncharacterized protein n=1 Tax=Cylicocyclus nassatus TaxID=53992 RepID=A0AA36HGW0_CYLNA|nr:unnamed protein product [Cylicocyclus nassatus]